MERRVLATLPEHPLLGWSIQLRPQYYQMVNLMIVGFSQYGTTENKNRILQARQKSCLLLSFTPKQKLGKIP